MVDWDIKLMLVKSQIENYINNFVLTQFVYIFILFNY